MCSTPFVLQCDRAGLRPAKLSIEELFGINHRCVQRTTDSALRKSGKKNGRRLRRRKRERELVRVAF